MNTNGWRLSQNVEDTRINDPLQTLMRGAQSPAAIIGQHRPLMQIGEGMFGPSMQAFADQSRGMQPQFAASPNENTFSNALLQLMYGGDMSRMLK